MTKRIHIPEQVAFIIERLMENGFEAYVVGGCVRDSVMGKAPKDWDVTTSAKPEQVKDLFPRTLDTGIRHGTVTVMMGKTGYEVTTYRIDGEYEDGRHPKDVAFTTNVLEDLKRRDFTINAMAYNPKSGLLDAFEGIEDIERGRIRCVGDPVHRFKEDALRMLRAVRFSASLRFEIEEETANAVRKQADNIRHVSAERVREEMNRMLTSEAPDRIRAAYELGLTGVFLPEFDRMMETRQNIKYHIYTVGEHTIRAMDEMKKQVADKETKEYSILCWATLLHDVAKPLCLTTDARGVDHFYGHDAKGAPMAKSILRRLKFDNDTIDTVGRLVKWHDYRFGKSKKEVRKAVSKIGEDLMEMLFLVKRADAKAHNPKFLHEKEEGIALAEGLFQQIVKDEEALTIKDLAVNGKDLMGVGIAPGKEMGVILKEMLELVLEDPKRNEKEALLHWVKEKINHNGKHA